MVKYIVKNHLTCHLAITTGQAENAENFKGINKFCMKIKYQRR
jgi:hypothetical protein